MDLGNNWTWEKQKLPADLDMTVHREADGDDEEFAKQFNLEDQVELDEYVDGLLGGSKRKKKKKKQFSENADADSGSLKRTASTKTMASKSLPVLPQPLILSAAESNMNKQHLTPIKTLPYRRRLDKKLEALRVPDRKPKTYDASGTSKPRARGRTRKLESLAQVPQFTNTQGQPVVVEKAKPVLAEKHYDGDLFGTRGEYIEGMLYRSRMKKDLRDHSADQGPSKAAPEVDLVEGNGENANTEELEEGVEGESEESAMVTKQRQEEAEELAANQWEAKRRCANTLRNWSFQESNRLRMVKEGSIKALITLSKIPDKKTREYCATAFRNLASQQELRQEFIKDRNSIFAIVELCNNNGHDVSQDCASSLCHLSCMQGGESVLVDEGAVPQLMALLQEFSDIAPICSRTLFNLTCVNDGYDRIERVIKATVTLCCSPTSTVETREICVSALCNLSNIPRVRAKMVDEGVVNTLGGLVRDSSDRTKMLMSLVMNNLASEKVIRGELVKKGTVQVLITLADTDELERQHWCAAALFKLVQDRSSRVRIVEEGAVNALSTISKAADKGKRPTTMRLCAGALLTLATFDDSKQMIVDQGAVPVLIALAKSSDTETKQNCTLGLCSLLSLRDSAISIMQQGAVSALVQLSNNDNEDTRASCAAVLFNLSCSAQTGELVVKEGFVPAILTLAKALRQTTKLCCAATLCNLATIEPNRRRMVDERVVPCLVVLMTHAASEEVRDNECVRHCTAALCSLSYDSTNTIEIVKDVKVMRAIAQGTWTEVETQKSMCTVLANLTFLEASRASLAELGSVSQLIALSALDDASTRHRCALAFCNLSCETSIREKMVEEGVVKVLASLSDSSYKEDNQQDCAKAICNLSAHPGTELQIVNEGAVPSLMMVAMVRAVKPETKEVSAKSLLNLLTAESLPLMVSEGLPNALAHLAKLESKASMNSCARGYAMITMTKIGRDAVCARVSLITPLFRMIRSSKASVEVKVIAGKAMCNLLMHEESRIATVEAGAVSVLPVLATLAMERSAPGSDESDAVDGGPSAADLAALLTSDALYMLSCCEVGRKSLLQQKVLPQLTQMALAIKDGDAMDTLSVKLSVSRALAMMGWFEETRLQLCNNSILAVIDQLVDTTTSVTAKDSSSDSKRSTSIVPVLEGCVRALCYLSMELSQNTLTTMVQCGMTAALVRLRSRIVAESPKDTASMCLQLIGLTLRNLSQAKGGERKMVNDGAVPLLCTLVEEVGKGEAAAIAAKGAQEAAAEAAAVAKKKQEDEDAKKEAAAEEAEGGGNGGGDGDATAAQEASDKDQEQASATATAADDGKVAAAAAIAQAEAEAKLAVSEVAGNMNVDLSLAFCNLAFQPDLRDALLQQGGLEALTTLAHTAVSDCDGNWRCAAALGFLALRKENRQAMVKGGAVTVLVGLAGRSGSKMETQRECCAAVCSLSKCLDADTRLDIVRQGATPLLIRLSKSMNAATVKSCSVGLSNLSTAGSDVDEGTVSALISMSINNDEPPPRMNTKSSVGINEEDLPPPLPLRVMESPGSVVAALVEVQGVHVVTRLKQTAGMAGSGPPTECPDLMVANTFDTSALSGGGGGGVEGEEGEEVGGSGAGKRTFPKLELSPEMSSGLEQPSLMDGSDQEESYGE